MLPSTYDDWPEKDVEDVNHNGRYKFSSVSLYFSQDESLIERQTYSALEWLGDVGGLYDGLRLSILLIMTPLASFTLKVELVSSVFHYLKSFNKSESLQHQYDIKEE